MSYGEQAFAEATYADALLAIPGQRIEWFVPFSEPVLPIPRYHHEAPYRSFDALLGDVSIVVGSASLTLTTHAPALVWAPLYGEAEFVVPAENEYTVR